jgi:nickel-dependent lactate racemase
VTDPQTHPVDVRYGRECHLALAVDADRLVTRSEAPQRIETLEASIRNALATPLDFPPLQQAVIPGDRVVIALDFDTPAANTILAAIWDVLAEREVDPEDVLVLQPRGNGPAEPPDPRGDLPEEIRERIVWRIHDPQQAQGGHYLASSASGERVYLAKELIEADLVIPIGPVAFDSVLGYRGTHSVLYPGLSNADSLSRALGQGDRELEPSDQRPLRQLIDDVGWLLGVQFCVQVVPAAGSGVAGVWAGLPESVFRTALEFLETSWRVELDQRSDIVVASIESDAGGHGWEQVGRALEVARNLVTHEGRILLLTDLDETPGDGLKLIRGAEAPLAALSPLKSLAPLDLVPATQCVEATDWARVYLLSQLDSDLVEDLFITPLEHPDEVTRLLSQPGQCVIVENAQHAYGRVRINE